MSTIDFKAKKNRTRLSGLLAVVFLIFAQPELVTLCAGAVFIVLGESIRIWSSGYIHKNKALTVTGPYSLSRNPLYVGSFIVGAGFILAMGVPWLGMVFLVFFILLYRYTVRWEEAKLERLFPDQWPEYFTSVPRAVPVLRWPGYVPGEFNWSQVRKNRELWNALAVLGVYAVLWGKAVWMR